MPDWEAFYNRFRGPDFVPGYEIQNRLGGGAFGEVFKARKTSIGKAYAIKFLRLDEASQRDAVERELEHVRLFAAIDHPHLVTIEDMGMVMDVPYLIMGYAGEETLARRLESGDLDREESLRYFVQACRGVLALHDRRLAHFDLKPSNIFLKGDVARVGDYGLAKLLADGRKTLSFGRGTPHYMAPEMLKNRADHRADIYSLGVILYESVSGDLPFGRKEDSGFGVLVREDDRPPDFPADFPLPLRRVVECSLRVDPDRRYRDVHALLDDLGQTARQGDSVVVPWGASDGPRTAGAAAGAAPNPTGDGAGRDGPPTPLSSTGEDLRTAAVELARGAVEVARGVWDGVVATARPTEGAAPVEQTGKTTVETNVETDAEATAETEPSPAALSRPSTGDVVSVQTLDEGEAAQELHDPSANGKPRRMLGILDRVRRERSGEAPPPDEDSAPFEETISAEWESREPSSEWLSVGAPSAATIPVPPRSEGGLLGGAVATLVLGLEVLVALVSGPILYAARALGRVADRLFRRIPGILGRVARWGFFVLFFFTIGAVIMFAFLVTTSQW